MHRRSSRSDGHGVTVWECERVPRRPRPGSVRAAVGPAVLTKDDAVPHQTCVPAARARPARAAVVAGSAAAAALFATVPAAPPPPHRRAPPASPAVTVSHHAGRAARRDGRPPSRSTRRRSRPPRPPRRAPRRCRRPSARSVRPYRYGASGPNAFDCSGLVNWAFKSSGKSLPRTSRAMSRVGTPGRRSRRCSPVTWCSSTSRPSHVGIYVGNGKVVHASSRRSPVKVSDMGPMPFNSARRV